MCAEDIPGCPPACRHAPSNSLTSSRGHTNSLMSTAPVAAAAAAAPGAAPAGLAPPATQQLGTAVISEAEAVQLLRHKFVLRNSTLDKWVAQPGAGAGHGARGWAVA